MEKIKVAELFAGVGGFRLGLEGWQGLSPLSGYTKKFDPAYKVVWSNQYEPSTRIQHASDIYEKRFGKEGHFNLDISKVDVKDIPDHDMLVGGFPCQDYSVAKQLSQSQGIAGKKGVLWWDIHRILQQKGEKKAKYLFLENVDRLTKSPVKQRGRDLAIMLASLSDLGYVVEWRVINAADHGMPQRRRRIFLLAYHSSTSIAKKIKKAESWIRTDGVFANAFPIADTIKGSVSGFELKGDLIQITNEFNKETGSVSPFKNAGIMIDRKVTTLESIPDHDGKKMTLADVLIDAKDVPDEFFIDKEDLDKWKYLKGAKREERTKLNGHSFFYTEGGLPFPDPIDKPARTIITAEGGRTPSRFKHVVLQNKRLRRLTPIELERLNMFPDDHTAGAKPARRGFFMGNALVVGIIEKVGVTLANMIK